MSKKFRFWLRCSVVATLTVFITFNPAWAGRGLRKWLQQRKANCCCPVEVCSCEPAAPPPTTCEPTIICCDSAPVEVASPAPTESSAIGQIVEPHTPVTPSQPETKAPEVKPAEPTPTEPKAVETKPEVDLSPSDTPQAPAESIKVPETSPEPAVEPAAPAAEVEVPAAVEPDAAPAEKVDDLFAPPAEDAPAVDPPANEVPAVEPPAEEAKPVEEDLFAPPADAMPAEENAPAENAPDADLFGNPPADPVEPPAQEPAADNPAADNPAAGIEDLFAPPADAPAADAPVADAPAADAPAADAPAADPLGDLFADPPADPPADAPANDPAADLFGNPPEAPANEPAEDPAADLFGNPPPADAPAAEDDNKQTGLEQNNNLEDLFGAPVEEKEAQADDKEDPLADLFKTTRVWKDNTGNFTVDAMLFEVHPDKVRLLKTNGKFCSVPLNRLSLLDRELVETVAKVLPKGQVRFVSTN